MIILNRLYFPWLCYSNVFWSKIYEQHILKIYSVALLFRTFLDKDLRIYFIIMGFLLTKRFILLFLYAFGIINHGGKEMKVRNVYIID